MGGMEMEIRSLELLAEQVFSINTGDSFGIEVKINHELVPELSGYDFYEYPCLLTSGRRISATGRSKRYSSSNLVLSIGAFEAEPPVPQDIRLTPYDHPRLYIITGLPGQKTGIISHGCIRWRYGAGRKITDLPLRSPAAAGEWVSQNKYLLDLTPWLRILGPGQGK
jgi:hypothetical protein